jgi:hypothetical protein
MRMDPQRPAQTPKRLFPIKMKKPNVKGPLAVLSKTYTDPAKPDTTQFQADNNASTLNGGREILHCWPECG